MFYGPIAPKKLPQQNPERLIALLDRWQRSSAAMQAWAERAKLSTDFVEGRHWDRDTLIKMQHLGRPALTLNKTNRLVRLMTGYFCNNRTDLKFQPGHDGTGVDATADALTALCKSIANSNQLSFTDIEVFMDGLITGRGYYEHRMSFLKNDFGDAEVFAGDPFSTYLDPDGMTYDLNDDRSGCGYICKARMANLDEIEVYFGKEARQFVEPFAYGATPSGSFAPTLLMQGETTPIRRFGESDETGSDWWDNIYTRLGMFYDPLRKTLRVMDFQHKMLVPTRYFLDLETGDRREIPDNWSQDKIKRVIHWAREQGSPLAFDRRMARKIRWTTIIADLIVYDDWSPYETYTVTGFFPYFRRGMTRGMVEDLIDPNKEINKARSAQVDILTRTAHSGWIYHERSLDPVQEARLKREGSEAGFNLKWKGTDSTMKPERLSPLQAPAGLFQRERAAGDDLHEISGINESALGEIDIGQSGRAIEARQRQAVVAVQLYMTNFSRTKHLQGTKLLELIQGHYTEARSYRVLGENGKPMTWKINQRDAVGNILNNVTLGSYDVTVDERPLQATFNAAQFQELLDLLEKLGPIGQMLAQKRPDLIIDLSSLPRKDEWKEALQEMMTSPPNPTPMDQATLRLKEAQAFSAMGTGAMGFAKAATTVQQGEIALASLDAQLSAAQQPPAPSGPVSPPGPGGDQQPAAAPPSPAAAPVPQGMS